MRILVIGSGGREHAICWKLKKSPLVEKIYCAPGNGGTGIDAVNVDIDVALHKEVIKFCGDNQISLVVVGPEVPLAVGITDNLEKAGFPVFGPSYAASRMESSKIFAKELMGRYDIPTARFRIFDDFRNAGKYIKAQGAPIVVKAYGLAAGKGVVIAETTEEAVRAAENMLVEKAFGSAGEKIIVEEFLTGEEASLIVVTDGEHIIPLVTSQDHKRAYDGDTGPNTGGMGAYSPAPVMGDELLEEAMNTVIRPTIAALANEGIAYKGVLYAGLMITPEGLKVLEYNVRFGDPETQVVLPRMKTDLAELFMQTAKGDISSQRIQWDARDCVCVVLSAGGYPGAYEKDKGITGLEKASSEGALIFHAGTRREGDKFLSAGGRVLNVVAMGDGIEDAVKRAYDAAEKIHYDGMFYRKDIGYRAIARLKNTVQ